MRLIYIPPDRFSLPVPCVALRRVSLASCVPCVVSSLASCPSCVGLLASVFLRPCPLRPSLASLVSVARPKWRSTNGDREADFKTAFVGEFQGNSPQNPNLRLSSQTNRFTVNFSWGTPIVNVPFAVPEPSASWMLLVGSAVVGVRR